MSEESSSESARKLVLPGDLMETKSKPGRGIFRKDGRIHASVGTTGGYGILQTTPQIIYNLL